MAELDAQIEVQSTSVNPSNLFTPANAPMPKLVPYTATFLDSSTLQCSTPVTVLSLPPLCSPVPLTITTQGRNPRQGEAIM